MKCNEWDSHKFTVSQVDTDAFEYTGNFNVIATSQGAVLVEKQYVLPCPECNRGAGSTSKGRLYKDKLEMIPHDNLPYAEDV